MNKQTYKLDVFRSKGHGHFIYIYFFMRWFRKSQEIKFKPIKNLYKFLFHFHTLRHGIVVHSSTTIGPGLCLWYPFDITIAQDALIGRNVTIVRNTLIGREFRGERHGAPKIGNNVWIGANAVIVGKITVGSNVLIAPNSFVNCDIPDNSIVFGNPCTIKHSNSAVDNYIERRIEWFFD